MSYMTLNNIIVSTLNQLDRSHDAHSIEIWRDKLTGYINDAVRDLALEAIKPKRRESVAASGGIIDLSLLKRECVKVTSVEKNGVPIAFSETETGKVFVNANGNVTITYRFVPNELVSPTDEPELPSFTHALIITYAVGMDRMSGEVNTQGGGNIFLSMYEVGKNKLKNAINASDASYIINKW
ncbi:MAG: hypothetical protein RR398_04570 [Clostridia bacterium]